MGEVNVVATIDGSSSLFNRSLQIGYLVDGRIVAHHHTVETHITTKDILKNLAVGNASDAMHIMIARHHCHTTRQADHRLVGQQDLLHQLLLFCITAAAIAKVVLRAGANARLQVTLLQTFYEGGSHHG